jgi:uncharacterized protein (TIGR02145 family)
MKKTVLNLVFILAIINLFAQQTGTFKDTRDGKVYKTVKIGNQLWFAENLSYKANSGCWAYNNDETNVPKYGRLYNWETSKNVCPSGWHLPSDAEWTKLSDYLGGDNIAGGKMKTNTDWQYDANSNASNESSFSALPAGGRDNDGSFDLFSSPGLFWTSTTRDNENVWIRNLNYKTGTLYKLAFDPAFGLSVRCLKD